MRERSDVVGAGHPGNDSHVRGSSAAHLFRLWRKNGGRPRCTSTSSWGGLFGGMLVDTGKPRGRMNVSNHGPGQRVGSAAPATVPESSIPFIRSFAVDLR